MPHVSGTPSRRGVARREQILDAAEETFAAGGYAATTLRALAKNIGMTHAGILRHYASKEDLLRALLERWRSRTEAAGRTGPSGDDLIRLHLTLLGEAAGPDHPAHSFVADALRTRRERRSAVDSAQEGSALEYVATQDGLRILSAYLPDQISPAEVTHAHLGGRRGTSGTRASADWIPQISSGRPHVPSGRRQASDDRTQEILDAASTAFAQHGYRATSLRSIATGIGLNHSTLLYYFDSKETLLAAILNRRDRDADTAYLTPVTAYDKVANVYRRAVYNETVPDRVRLYSALLCESIDPAHPAHAHFASRYARVLDALTSELHSLQTQRLIRPDLNPRAEAAWFIALWDGLQLHASYESELHIPERLLHALDELFSDNVSHERRAQLLTTVA
ncbi:TetR/AcrR family transcriptional regulator [Streptomyces sp. NPDC056943]|uniref:TetR/AcrR family transcriptional regulator n=1 Tax=Streptomyces sp. NPDC056943 TaxID=3345971 RepID=UPI0036389DB2